MRARFIIPALWLLSLLLPAPRVQAQGRPLGPWQIVNKKVRTSDNDDAWGIANRDTATHLVKKTWLLPACWDIAPDSIRLFLNCENPLVAPSQPPSGQPRIHFSATGATIRIDTLNHQLMLFIIPSMPIVTLSAYRGKALVFKHVFKSISPPVPHIECFIGGGRLSSSRHPERFSVHLKAIPQPDFASFMPDDAKYRVSQYQIILLRNGVQLGATKVIGKLTIANEVPLYSAQSGDVVRIDVQQMQRQNFRGVVEDIPYIKQITVELL